MTDAIDLTALDQYAREQFKKRFEELDSVKESREAIDKNLFTIRGEAPEVKTYHDLEKYFLDKAIPCKATVGGNVLTLTIPKKEIPMVSKDLARGLPFFVITIFRRMSIWTRIRFFFLRINYEMRYL